jgi:two-component system, NarL family, invasion response regulator UvrY
MTKILIVDDHEVVRDGVKSLFEAQRDTTAFGDATTAAEALQLITEQHWDIVVLDISLGGRSGLEVLKELKQMRPRLPVLVLSMHSEEQYARRAFNAGAAGYITKDSSRTELFQAIEKVRNGRKYVTSALAEKLIVYFDAGAEMPPEEALSDREFEVLRLIGSGKAVTEIAQLLGLSVKTISTYRTRLLEKMHMQTNAELTRYAVENRLIDGQP